MNKKSLTLIAIAFLTFCTAIALADDNVDGVFGINGFDGEMLFGIYVPVDPAQAVSGIRWFNNDSAIIFPEFFVAAGNEGAPEQYFGAMTVGSDVSGVESGWSELKFPTSLISASDGLYFVIRLPIGAENSFEGVGDGAGIGYKISAQVPPVEVPTSWLRADGETWDALEVKYQMAIEPIYAPNKSAADASVTVVGADSNHSGSELTKNSLPMHQGVILAYPNPFNPATTISFNLAKGTEIGVSIFTIRGSRIASLYSGWKDQGDHSIVWSGRDAKGNPAASGVYFVVLSAGGEIVATTRIALLK